MLSSANYLNLSSLIHTLEEFPVALPNPSVLLKAVLFGIPIAVLCHELSDWWVPKNVSVPVLTWFRRRWIADASTKAVDMLTFRNLALFFGVASIMHGGVPKTVPLDYISDRLTCTATRKRLDKIIVERRVSVFAAANEIMAAHAFDDAKAAHLREEAIHRRSSQEVRL